MGNDLRKLTDEEVLIGLTNEIIKCVIDFRDGKTPTLKLGKFDEEAKKRKLKLEISKSFIHRIFQGEFDNAKVKVEKVESK